MQDRTQTDGAGVAAGNFGAWLAEVRASLQGDGGTNVPCGDCVGCCVSSYFIPIRPKDSAARAAIPAHFLVVAPGQPSGHAMLGFLEDGACPMLKAGACSIYEHRPQTCRDYDCRIFSAAGIDAGGSDKSVINRRVHEWRFTFDSDEARAAHSAVRAAAAFIQSERESFPNRRAPTAPTGIAVLAVKVYKIFLDADIDARAPEEIARDIIKASAEFDAAAS